MSPKSHSERPKQPRPAELPRIEVKKRFRIEKIEERIAPKSPKKTGSSIDQNWSGSIY
jgi:hypothetical protein